MRELDQIYKDGHIDELQFKNISSHEANKLFSIHWELRTILYLGILLLLSGIGILVYQNIDTIGHQAILGAIAAACLACFYFVIKNKLPYHNGKVLHESPFFDYIVLLGCLLFALFVGYFQFQYSPFGQHYGLLVFIPTVLSFFMAYRFDHRGVLSIAIAGLAGTFGLSISPRQLLNSNDFSDLSIIFTALAIGIVLSVWAWYSDKKEIKKHFGFTYNNFAINILCIALLAALFEQNFKFLSFITLGGVCFYFIFYALSKHSYLFLLLSILYGYIGLTYLIFSFLFSMNGSGVGPFFIGMLYIIASAGGVIVLFLKLKKIVKG